MALVLPPQQFPQVMFMLFPFVLAPQTRVKGWGAEVGWEERRGQGEVTLNAGDLLTPNSPSSE